MKHSGDLMLNVISKFQRSGRQGDLFLLFLCQAPWGPPSLILISWTFSNSPAHLIPDTTFHFLITHLLQTETHPWLYLTPCADVPSPLMCADVLNTHSCSSPFDTSTSFTNWATLYTSETHFWFKISTFLFSISPFIILHQALDSVVPPKQTHTIVTLLCLFLMMSLLLLPALLPAILLTSCTVSNTMNSSKLRKVLVHYLSY